MSMRSVLDTIDKDQIGVDATPVEVAEAKELAGTWLEVTLIQYG